MMVLIKTNINHLMILICSIVFLLSSFVSSQQKPKYYEDPREFYNYALHVRNYYPRYYADHYPRLLDQYNKLMSAAEAKRNIILKGETSKHNRQLKQNVGSNSAGPKIAKQIDDRSKPPLRTPLVYNFIPLGKEPKNKTIRTYRSRSLDFNPERLDLTFLKAGRDNKTIDGNIDRDWAYYCFTLGYNRTNVTCDADPNEHMNLFPNVVIKRVLNIYVCRVYFTIGCQFRSNQELCAAGANEAIRNPAFNCVDEIYKIDINAHRNKISSICCMHCKDGLDRAKRKEICFMPFGTFWQIPALEKCCENASNRNETVSYIESKKLGSKDEKFAEMYLQLSKV